LVKHPNFACVCRHAQICHHKRHQNVVITILTKSISSHLLLDVKKFNEQYPSIEIKDFNNAHDRFIVLTKIWSIILTRL